jgi:hypothetical protein
MDKQEKKTRIYKDQAKDRHTTHWDMDYLPRKEVDALYEKSEKKRYRKEPDTEGDPSRIGWTLVISGVALLFLSVLLVLRPSASYPYVSKVPSG